MPHYQAIHAFALAFFSKPFYRDVLLRWKGLGFTHLLLLNILLITPAIVFVVLDADDMVFDGAQPSALSTSLINEVTSQIPAMQFDNGVLSSEAEQPHFIYAHFDGERVLLAMIDLDASVSDLQTSTARMLITSEAIHARNNFGKIETQYWADMMQSANLEYFRLNSDVARDHAYAALDWLGENKLWVYLAAGIALWCGTLLVMFMYRALQALILGGAVILFAGMQNVQLTYSDAVRLTCFAITPPILSDAVLMLLLGDGISFPLFLMLTLGYCFFAVHSNKESA